MSYFGVATVDGFHDEIIEDVASSDSKDVQASQDNGNDGNNSSDDNNNNNDHNNNNTDEKTTSGGSHKTIGMFGSLSIAVNALAGPAILQLPFTFQQAGIIPTTFCLIVVAMLSALCCTHTASVVSKVPGDNHQFDQTIEFSDPFRIFWSRRAYKATQVIFYACTLCVNIAAIVDTAEIVDSFLGHWKGTWAYAFDEGGEIQEWVHTHNCSRQKVKLGKCMPFASENYGNVLLTLGYLITAAVFVPICLMDLKENTKWQIFGFIVLLTISLQFVISFYLDGMQQWNYVSLWGETWDSMLGVIMFNFGLVMAIPAWLGEKKPNVSVTKIVYGSTAISLVLYISVGLLGAMAIPHVNVNMLQPMVSGAFGFPLRMGASVFAFFIIGLDIPLFSVLTRYNLVNSGLCSTRTANILVVYLPWGFGWLFYQGSAISELLSWGGILFTGAVAFILPLYLAVRVLIHYPEETGSVQVYGNIFTSNQAQLKATKALFIFACLCVIVAIIGQAVYDDERERMMHVPGYLNDTTHSQGVDSYDDTDGNHDSFMMEYNSFDDNDNDVSSSMSSMDYNATTSP